jgi:hypothetical protein
MSTDLLREALADRSVSEEASNTAREVAASANAKSADTIRTLNERLATNTAPRAESAEAGSSE